MEETVERFRIWYVGGETAEGETFDDWVAAPDSGVLVVMLYFGEGYRGVENGNDFYWATEDGEYGQTDEEGDIPEGASVKVGSWSSDEEHDQALADAMAS